MNKKLKQVIAYIIIPLAFVFIGIAIYFFAIKPIEELANAKWKLATIKGGPGFDNEFNENLIKANEVANGGKGFQDKKMDVPAIGTYYGKLICEEISLNVPLYYGDTEEILKNGVGQYTGSGLPGYDKPILIGGHDATFFQPLEKVKDGDILKIVTNNGIYSYQVTDEKIYNHDDQSAYDLKKEEEQIILYTCYPFGALTGSTDQRYFVYGKKIENAD